MVTRDGADVSVCHSDGNYQTWLPAGGERAAS